MVFLRLVEERGDLSVRGAILDIYAPGYSRPLRLEFIGDRLESIREFDPSSQRSQSHHEEIIILPMQEFYLEPGQSTSTFGTIEARAEELLSLIHI